MAAAAAAPSSQQQLLSGDTFFLDSFALRQWDDPNYSGTRLSCDKAAFLARLHELFEAGGRQLVDGYAPFCKHVFVPNEVGALVGALEVTPSNRHLLRSGYTRRRPEELPVLTRWFSERDVAPVPTAAFLDVILYSREQLVREYEAMPHKAAAAAAAAAGTAGGGKAAAGAAAGGEEEGEVEATSPSADAVLPRAPWGVISVKAQMEGFETPMQPITMMRNALGREEGGSGVPLDRAAYEASAAYWQRHAPIVAGDEPSGE